ncbi:hypothetical protein N9Z47_00995 [bacterium]|nr:hypothetical protein [Mariniblastus sp.]MDB4385916.1 hypothetical protein [bacterium]
MDGKNYKYIRWYRMALISLIIALGVHALETRLEVVNMRKDVNETIRIGTKKTNGFIVAFAQEQIELRKNIEENKADFEKFKVWVKEEMAAKIAKEDKEDEKAIVKNTEKS